MSDALPSPRPCRLCGVPLIFARTAEGKVMPLDAKATTVYVTTDQIDLLGKTELTLGDRIAGHVSHWVTCTNADAFRTSGRGPPKGARQSADEG